MTHQNLARRMRPRNIDEIIGQSHLVGPKKLFAGWLKQNF